MLAPVAGVLASPLCLPCPALSSVSGRGVLGALAEPTFRLYSCHRCAVQVRICRRCDHGNLYCAGECSRICRREALRRAGARYQRTLRGSRLHAARQRRYRDRARQKVTHQGCRSGGIACSVSVDPLSAEESTDARHEPLVPHPAQHKAPARCAFCAAVLPAWTRIRAWSWGG